MIKHVSCDKELYYIKVDESVRSKQTISFENVKLEVKLMFLLCNKKVKYDCFLPVQKQVLKFSVYMYVV